MILLVGAGAVGTILAAHVVAGKAEPLKLYVRDKDLAGMAGASALRVSPVTPGRPALVNEKPALVGTLDLTGVDYLFICVKYPQLDALLAQLPPVPASCTVVSTLNGIGHLRLIRQRLPQARVVPMTIMFNGQLLGLLHAQITTRASVIVGSDDPRLLGCFGASGMSVARAQGEAAAWGKILINLGNAIGALTHSTFKDLLSQPDLRAIYAAVLEEATGVLDRAGIPYRLMLPYPVFRLMMRHGGPLPWWFAKARNGLQEGAYPSMVADVEAGKKTEVAQLNGEIVALAADRKLAAPLNARIVELVGELEGKVPPPRLTPAELKRSLGM